MDILNKIKQIQALSEIGIHYAHNGFDLERYREIGDLCFNVLSGIVDIPVDVLKVRMIESDGYKTPKVDVRAVVFNENHEILMVREKIDDCWSLPGGWADIGYTPSEVAVKESREEACADVEPVRLLGIMDKRCHNHPSDLYYIYKIFLECKFNGWVEGDRLETTEVGFFASDNLPTLSAPRNTPEQIRLLFDFHSGQVTQPFFD